MDRGSCQHQRRPPRRLGDIQEEAPAQCLPESLRRPETPTEAMEFLARSWSVSAAELSRALSNTLLSSPKVVEVAPPLPADDATAPPTDPEVLSISPSSEKALSEHVHQKLVLQPPPSVQPFGGSPPFSPKDGEDLKLYIKAGHRTVGGWLKDQKEKRRQEARARDAQIHAATAVAGVAAAVAAVAAAAFSSPAAAVVQSPSPSKTSAAIASAAALVASHCIEMAQAMGADRAQILTVVGSAVSIHTTGDIMALTAGAATALRAAATFRARLQKGIHNEQLPREGKELGGRTSALDFVSKGGVLLKRTRKGVLHWKKVSVYINEDLQVVIKMKSMHMGGTFVKKKKSVVIGIDSETPQWPGREKEEGSNHRAYFGIKTPGRFIEFECRSKNDKQFWIEGIQQMLQSHVRMTAM